MIEPPLNDVRTLIALTSFAVRKTLGAPHDGAGFHGRSDLHRDTSLASTTRFGWKTCEERISKRLRPVLATGIREGRHVAAITIVA